MGQEIERKFRVRGDAWRQGVEPVLYRQGYLASEGACTVRVRRQGDEAFLTIKGKPTGPARPEYEYEIPVADAEELLTRLCPGPLVEKQRYTVEHAGLTWEIDEFLGDNRGLIVAEVELAAESQAVPLPVWVGEEVTGDPRYLNVNLVRHPYSRWVPDQRG